MTNAQREKARFYIAEAITEWFGPRCPDFEPECPCCLSWAEYDLLMRLEAELEETKEALTIVTWNRDKLIESLGLEVIEDAQLNAIADERTDGPTVSVKLEDL